MFSFIAKNLERRLLYNQLLVVGLDLNTLNVRIAKQLLQAVHQQVVSVSKKYEVPVHVIAENIINSAAWGIAYCLLGPNKLLDVYPEFKDRTEEAEMELLLLESGERSENNIYHEVFSILLHSPDCHPEVRSLFDQTRLAQVTPTATVSGDSFLSLN
jgi:hypothetical protein